MKQTTAIIFTRAISNAADAKSAYEAANALITVASVAYDKAVKDAADAKSAYEAAYEKVVYDEVQGELK